MTDLKEIRKSIDAIDGSLVELFQKRLAFSSEVAEYKIANDMPVLDKRREDEKLAALSAMAGDAFEKQGILELFELIMSISRKKQYKMLAEKNRFHYYGYEKKEAYDFSDATVVYQGVEGAYSQVATLQFFGENVNAFCVDTWREAMEALSEGRAEYAVLPIENSTAGAVTQNLDLLAEFSVSIIAEQEIPIEHALLGLPDAAVSDIKKIYSHPQAIQQCDVFLREHMDIQVEAYPNTAMAAKKVMEDDDRTQGAIASKVNASIYGLKVLKESVQDSKNNVTRFIIVSAKKQFLSASDKISITFEIPDEEGSLYRILSHFIFNGLNMSKIESRPLPDRQWEYRFFIDFGGNLAEEAVQNMLRGLKEETVNLRILGNYS